MASETKDCIIRRARADDLLLLLQLYSRSDEGLRPRVDAASEIEAQTWDTILATENLTLYLAQVEHEVVGAAMFLTMPNLGYDCRPSGFIEAMVVSAPHRRRGIARMIIQQLLGDATSMGCHKIQLLTHKRHASDGAHDFYRSMGFEPEAEGFRLYLEPD